MLSGYDRWLEPPDPLTCSACGEECGPGDTCPACGDYVPTDDDLAEEAAERKFEAMRDAEMLHGDEMEVW